MVRKQYPVLELANQMPVRIWIWPEPLVAPRVRRALGTRMGRDNDVVSFGVLFEELDNQVDMNLKERFSSFQIVVVPDAETGKKVPEIPGLLEYRKDTKELYLRANKTWKIIAPEKKVYSVDMIEIYKWQ